MSGELERPLHVLVLIDSLSLGGAERLVATLASKGPAAGLRVSVAVVEAQTPSRAAVLPELRDLGVDVRFLGLPRLTAPQAVPAVARAIAASGCDLVHAHLEYSATLGPLAAPLVGRRVVSTFHHVPRPLPRRPAARERLAVEAASLGRSVIFVSEFSRDAFAARYGGCRRTWRVVRNGVDLEVFSPSGPVADLAVPPGAPCVALVASMRGGKGQRSAVRVWPQVRRQVPGATLCLVGSGPEEAELRGLAVEHGVAEAVVFAGARRDVAAVMRAADVVVLPSESEALPTVLMEAAACERPVVATDVGGAREVVVAGETGLLVPPHDDQALTAALVQLLRDPARRRVLGRAAAARAGREFDAQLWAVRLRQEYLRCVRPSATGRVLRRPLHARPQRTP